jgi:hypothetical protein
MNSTQKRIGINPRMALSQSLLLALRQDSPTLLLSQIQHLFMTEGFALSKVNDPKAASRAAELNLLADKLADLLAEVEALEPTVH